MFIRWITVTLVLMAILATSLWPCITLVESRKGGRGKVESKNKLKCGSHKPIEEKREKNRAGRGEFPFLTDITIIPIDSKNISTTYNCTGAIISKRRILTSLKCIEHGELSKVKYEIRLGNYRHSKGKLVEVKNTTSTAYSLSKIKNPVSHGLALIKLKHRIKYKLEPTTKNNSTDINRACFSQNKTFPMVSKAPENEELYAISWIPGHHRAKRYSMKMTKCEEAYLDKAICTAFTTSKNHTLQEGTPLVRYKGKKRWEVIGIHSRRYEPWADCDDDRCASEPYFIPVHEQSMKQFIIKEIWGAEKPGEKPNGKPTKMRKLKSSKSKLDKATSPN